MLGNLVGKLFSTSLGRRAMVAGGYIGAGYAGSALLQNRAELARSYYGDKEYDSRFKGYHEYASGASKLLGYVAGGLTMLGQEPISGTLKGAANLVSPKKFKGTLAARGLLGAGVFAMGASAMVNYPGATIASTAIPTAYAARKLLFATKGMTATIAGGMAAGAAFSMNRPMYPAAEGNITDVQYNRSSVVSRMNFSTAGLTQALYNNRKAI